MENLSIILASVAILMALFALAMIVLYKKKIDRQTVQILRQLLNQRRLNTDILKQNKDLKEFIGSDFELYSKNGTIEDPERDGYR